MIMTRSRVNLFFVHAGFYFVLNQGGYGTDPTGIEIDIIFGKDELFPYDLPKGFLIGSRF